MEIVDRVSALRRRLVQWLTPAPTDEETIAAIGRAADVLWAAEMLEKNGEGSLRLVQTGLDMVYTAVGMVGLERMSDEEYEKQLAAVEVVNGRRKVGIWKGAAEKQYEATVYDHIKSVRGLLDHLHGLAAGSQELDEGRVASLAQQFWRGAWYAMRRIESELED